MSVRTLGPKGVDCEIPRRLEGNETFFIRVWKPFPSIRVLKTLTPERENSKWTISTSGGLGPLQMVSEPDTRRCASEEAEPCRGVDTRQCASDHVGPRRGVDCEIPHRLERETKHSL